MLPAGDLPLGLLLLLGLLLTDLGGDLPLGLGLRLSLLRLRGECEADRPRRRPPERERLRERYLLRSRLLDRPRERPPPVGMRDFEWSDRKPIVLTIQHITRAGLAHFHDTTLCTYKQTYSHDPSCLGESFVTRGCKLQ